MQSIFHWKKGLFTSSYSIYSNNSLIGKLTEKALSQTSTGEINDKEYKFITNGFINQRTSILDKIENKKIGEIIFSNWMTKATLSIDKKTYYWRYENILNTKWRIFNAEGTEIKYNSSSTGGQIETNTDDSVLLLSGLFVKNYYVQITIAVLAALIPIWVTVIT